MIKLYMLEDINNLIKDFDYVYKLLYDNEKLIFLYNLYRYGLKYIYPDDSIMKKLESGVYNKNSGYTIFEFLKDSIKENSEFSDIKFSDIFYNIMNEPYYCVYIENKSKSLPLLKEIYEKEILIYLHEIEKIKINYEMINPLKEDITISLNENLLLKIDKFNVLWDYLKNHITEFETDELYPIVDYNNFTKEWIVYHDLNMMSEPIINCGDMEE